jgi:hypothetical protein
MTGSPGRRRLPAPRRGTRPCERCYRPLQENEERLCASCKAMAEKPRPRVS